MSPFGTTSIRTQLVLGIVLSLSIVGLALLLVLPRMEQRIMQDRETARLEGIAQAIASFTAPGVDFQDAEFVAETVDYFFTLPEVHGIEVYDAKGDLYCAAGDPLPDTEDAPVPLNKVVASMERGGEPLGTVVLISRSEALRAALKSSRMVISVITLFAIVIGALAAIGLGNYVLRPILDLHDATRTIAEGRLQVRVPVRGATELADLARAFNTMVERLRETTTSRDLLESEVAEKQRALEEVRRLKDRAEELSRVKSEFLANMSHEIRTPMNGILGLTELTLDTELDSMQREYLDGVLGAGRHLLAVLNDVLDLSKIEAGKLEIVPVPTDLVELLSSIGTQHGTVAASKGLGFHVSIAPDVPRYVLADGLRIRQILANLVGNALKFTRLGHVRIEARREETPRVSHARLRFLVSDTGIGIPEEKRSIIFHPFEQADGSTTRDFGGTGLGLTISRRLVRSMGGEIELESEVGRGSTFHFALTLPETTVEEDDWARKLRARRPAVRLQVSEPETRATLVTNLQFWSVRIVETRGEADLVLSGSELLDPEEALPPAEEARPPRHLSHLLLHPGGARLHAPFAPLPLGLALWESLGGEESEAAPPAEADQPEERPRLRVLVAEDNPTNQKVILRMLELLGHEVSLAQNGREAVDQTLARPFDLVLMDWHMPVLNGLAATEEIRRQGCDVPIVALTANALPGDRDACLAAGMNGYLSKPLRRGELAELLDSLERTKETRHGTDSFAA